MDKLVFVYGTLKRGFNNHNIIENSTFISDAITKDCYQMYPNSDYTFPYLIISEKSQHIKGELFSIKDNKTLELLDALEGYPILYDKKSIVVKDINGIEHTALVYHKNEEFMCEDINLKHPLNEWTKKIQK